jgi:site-specific DNA recombinase
LLTGLLYDNDGNRFVPTHASKGGKRYYYHTSQGVIHGKKGNAAGPSRLPADEIEQIVIAKVQTFLQSPHQMEEVLCNPKNTGKEIGSALGRAKDWAPTTVDQTRKLVPAITRRIIVRDDSVNLTLSRYAIREAVLGRALAGPSGAADEDIISIEAATTLKRCGGEVHLILPADSSSTARVEPPLVRAVARAHGWVDRIVRGEVRNQRVIAAETGLHKRYVGHVIRLAFLAPDLTEAILEGRQSPQLRLQRMLPRLPLS